jgi:hypothetical protein
VLNLQAKVALLDPAHISTIGAQLQVWNAILVLQFPIPFLASTLQ